MRRLLIHTILMCLTLLSKGQETVDTTGFAYELNQVRLLQWEDVNKALELTYKWDTKLDETQYYQEYAEIGCLHALNCAINISGEASVEICARTIGRLQNKPVSKQAIANLYAAYSKALNMVGDSDEALKNAIQAQKLYRLAQDTLGAIRMEVLLGETYSIQKNFEKSQFFFEKAIKELEFMEPGLELCEAYNAYATDFYYKYLYKTDVDLIGLELRDKYLTKSYIIAQKLGNKIYQAKALVCKGQLNILKLDSKQTESQIKSGIALFKSTSALYLEIQAQTILGGYYTKTGAFEESIKILIPASEIAAQNGWFPILTESYSYLANSYYKLGDNKNGALYGGRSFTFHKTIVNNKKALEMDVLTARYEQELQKMAMEQKNIELKNVSYEKNWWVILSLVTAGSFIVLLFMFIVISSKNKKLKELSSENEFLLGEANHRIKNNLQLIISLIAQEINKTKDEVPAALLNIRTRIESIATLHHHLYVNEEKKVIQLDDYLTAVCQNLNNLLKENDIKTDINIEATYCQVNAAVYFGLLLNELLMNSAKHAFSKNQTDKKITVLLKKEAGLLTFIYFDNGSGLSVQEPPRLIKLLCRQLKATFDILPKPGFYFSMKCKL